MKRFVFYSISAMVIFYELFIWSIVRPIEAFPVANLLGRLLSLIGMILSFIAPIICFLFKKFIISRRSYKPLQIIPSPGWRLRIMSESLFSCRTNELVLEPILKDLQEEHFEALHANRLRKARWVCFRGYYSFWSAVFSQLPISAVKMVYKIWQATR
jgi:hypothetical protein